MRLVYALTTQNGAQIDPAKPQCFSLYIGTVNDENLTEDSQERAFLEKMASFSFTGDKEGVEVAYTQDFPALKEKFGLCNESAQILIRAGIIRLIEQIATLFSELNFETIPTPSEFIEIYCINKRLIFCSQSMKTGEVESANLDMQVNQGYVNDYIATVKNGERQHGC